VTNEELAALGATLRQEFRALTENNTTGWLDTSSWSAKDLSAFWDLEAEAYRVFQSGYEFAALEAWLTSGYVPADLAELPFGTEEMARALSARAESVPAESAPVSPRFPVDTLWEGDQRSRSGGARGGYQDQSDPVSKPGTGSHPQRARPRRMQGHDTPVKGLKDLARLLESEHREGDAAGPETVHPHTPLGPLTDVLAPDRSGTVGLPDSSSVLAPSSVPFDDWGAPSNESSSGRALGEERTPFGPVREDKDEEAGFPPVHMGLAPWEKENVGLLSGHDTRNPSGARRLEPLDPDPFAAHRTDRSQMGREQQGSSAERPSGTWPATKRDGSPSAPFGLRRATRRVSAPDRGTPGGPSLPPYAPEQAHVEAVEFRVAREPGSGQGQSSISQDVSEMDLDWLLEAIAEQIQREYRRFYGS
jgi:hypothetical protein